MPTIHYLTDIHFGVGAVGELGEILSQLRVKRPLVATDAYLVKAGVVDRLGIEVAAVFDAVQTNPSEADVHRGLELYKAHGCDGLVAVGGGSPIDLAKAIGLGGNHGGPLEPYAAVRGGGERITQNMPPLVAIPTTAGTGSEVGRAALITFESGNKLALLSRHLIPRAAICDPQLTLSMPPALTAATGMDAISHCIETFYAPTYNPVADAIALDGLQRAFENIRVAFADGENIEARQQMMMAALQGGLTFQKGLGAVHALSHPLGALPGKRLHHGTLNAIFLPHVLRFNLDVAREKSQAIAERLGLRSAARLPEVFDQLRADLELPRSLGELGVTAADLEPMAEKAHQDHCSKTNARPVTREDLAQLYANALA